MPEITFSEATSHIFGRTLFSQPYTKGFIDACASQHEEYSDNWVVLEPKML